MIVYSIDQKHKRDLHEFAIKAIISDGLSFGIFRKPGMKKCIAKLKPGYVGPHRKTVRRKITNYYFENPIRLKSYLMSLSHIALTCDCWRSNAATDFILFV